MSRRNRFDEDENLAVSFNLKMAKRSFVYIRKEKELFFKAIFQQIVAILTGLCVPVITARAMDVAIPQKDIRQLVILSVLLVVCIAIGIYFTTLASRTTAIIGQNIVCNLRRDLYAHLQELSFSYFDSRPHGKIQVRVINYVDSVSNILSNGLINMLLQMMNLVFIAVFMFCMDVSLAWIVMSGLPFVLIFMVIIKPMQRKGWQQYSNKSSNMNAYLNESISCMKIAQLFVREGFNTDVYRKLIAQAKRAWYKAVMCNSAVGPYIDLVSKIVIVVMIMYGLFWNEKAVSFGVLLGMINYCSRFWQPINQLSNIYNSFVNSIAYLERIFETIDEPVEVKDQPDAITMPEIHGDVTFEDVSFAYENDVKVLHNVSFTVKAGESVALVGQTGSGKTTIINLLSRFYNCTEGRVLVDGQDISKVTLASLRAQMGLMMQDSFVFSSTIMENLRYGNLEAEDSKLIAAAKLVCADEFIQELPQGYQTVMSEGGSILSQGQRQLLALARTMASDPKILILDEATSSVDTRTERLLQQGVNQMLKGRTSFIVAHRLSTIKACDKIMYIEKGHIRECGTHDELIRKKGLYYRLCQNQ